mgnify:CR=1 FL=1
MSKYCSKCGAEIMEGSKFCKSCGAPVENTQATAANQKTQKQWSDKGQSKLTEHCQIPDNISPFFHKNLLLKISFYRQILTQSRVNGNFICENCLKINLYFLAYRQFFHTSKSNYMLANLFVFVAIQSFRID